MMTSKASPGIESTVLQSGEAATPRPAEGWTVPAGDRIDHFAIVRPLGHGGMGAVFLAHDTSLDRMVALKILPSELAGSAEAQERFIREARAQARLNSPNVVQIYFIGRVARDGDMPSLYFAMEVVDGEALDARIARGERLPPEDARKLMLEVARGLRDAQRAGIVHRDIKPANLLVTKAGVVKIADFGLAKPKDSALGLTAQRTIMGTPLYMAPEQANCDTLDHRADMYALGCSFYHLLAGAPPFEAQTSVALMLKHINEAEAPLRTREPRVPPKLAAIVARLMKKSPDERFASYDELVTALEDAAPERVTYAGFWARGVACGLDSVLASLLIAFLSWPGLLLHLVYTTVAHAYFGQTLGKYLLRVRVRRIDGSNLGLGRSLLRTLAALWLPFLIGLLILWTRGFSGLTRSISQLAEVESARSFILPIIVTYSTLTLLYGSGLFLAAVQRQKRAIHDFLVGSEVVYRLNPKPLVAATAAAAFAAALFGSSRSEAFCRSTTCTGDCERDADGCKTTGHPLAWPTSCVGFSVQKDGSANLPLDAVREVFTKSFTNWSSISCPDGEATIAFSQLADATCHAAEYDPNAMNANILLFQDDKWTFDGLDDTIARTTVSFDPATGQITDADIQLNYAYNDLTIGDGHVVYDLESVMTHEIGHFIGFDHSSDPDATMNAAYDEGSIAQRTLAADDIAAACAAYPPSRDARCDPAPHGGFSPHCTADLESGGCSLGASSASGLSTGIVSALLAIAIASRRRRTTS